MRKGVRRLCFVFYCVHDIPLLVCVTVCVLGMCVRQARLRSRYCCALVCTPKVPRPVREVHLHAGVAGWLAGWLGLRLCETERVVTSDGVLVVVLAAVRAPTDGVLVVVLAAVRAPTTARRMRVHVTLGARSCAPAPSAAATAPLQSLSQLPHAHRGVVVRCGVAALLALSARAAAVVPGAAAPCAHPALAPALSIGTVRRAV